ncbi:conserved protein of unknown function [Tenacibaculum sp. 190524A02b]|uniref:hypothetical protein n=1 Tax=Tenacibaculum vairaonense TaxID=3137860 RepID=UPI0032B239AF
MKNTNQNTPVNYCERIFKIEKKKNLIDLSQSLSIVNNKASRLFFEKEAYTLNFSTYHKGIYTQTPIFVTANECIPNEEIKILQKQLGIEIDGCGMYFSILNYSCNFSIQVDPKNSVFIDTPSVKNGYMYFYK